MNAQTKFHNFKTFCSRVIVSPFKVYQPYLGCFGTRTFLASTIGHLVGNNTPHLEVEKDGLRLRPLPQWLVQAWRSYNHFIKQNHKFLFQNVLCLYMSFWTISNNRGVFKAYSLDRPYRVNPLLPNWTNKAWENLWA